MNWDWPTILEISFIDGEFTAAIGPGLWLSLVVLLLAVVLCRLPWLTVMRRFKVKRVAFSALGTTVEIERNEGTVDLAHAAYIELITRKAAIPFDNDHDVIVEVYDSWYELFAEIRRLVRQVGPAELESNEDLRRLHDVLLDILNKGLRPHLTRWQAGFRRWYEAELAQRPGEPPQMVQRDFHSYDDLVRGIEDANRVLICLANELRQLRTPP